MKKNICIIGLPVNFSKTTAKALADSLDMYYADINDMLKFDLLDIKKAEKLAGKSYILKLETSKIKTVSSYENTVITLNYGSLTNNDNYDILKKEALIIYLKAPIEVYEKLLSADKLTKSQKTIAMNVYADRDYICTNLADISVKISSNSISNNLKNIIKAIKDYYKGLK